MGKHNKKEWADFWDQIESENCPWKIKKKIKQKLNDINECNPELLI